MRRLATAVVTMLLLFSFVPTGGFAQNLNGTIGGFVQDPTRAYIPGATVTATNTQTGVVTMAFLFVWRVRSCLRDGRAQ